MKRMKELLCCLIKAAQDWAALNFETYERAVVLSDKSRPRLGGTVAIIFMKELLYYLIIANRDYAAYLNLRVLKSF